MEKFLETMKKAWKGTVDICKKTGKAIKHFFTDDKMIWLYRKVFIVPIPVIIFCFFTAMPLVAFALKSLDSMHPLSIIFYIYSAYSFTVLCIGFPRIIRRTKELIHGDEVKLLVAVRRMMNKYKYSRLYLNDREFRAKTALYAGFTINLVYAVYRCCTGIFYRSAWMWAIGIYYIMLGIIRLVLLKNVRITDRQEYSRKRTIQEYKSYRTCGIMMLLLNAAMMGMAVQMIWKNRGYEYSGSVIYISALYTFYCFINSTVNAVRFAKRNNAVLSAAKNLSLAGAFMAVFTLQTAMLTSFGGNDDSFRRLMNTLTGSAVCIIVLAMAVVMIVTSNRKIKNLRADDSKHNINAG